MYQSTAHTDNRRNSRTVFGAVLALIGALCMTIGVFSSPVAADVDTQNVPLGNEGAGTGTDCPDGENDYWHFIIAPNNDTYAFVTITLDLGDGPVVFDGADIIPNGVQLDNVFVQVPADKTLASIVTGNSHADITPATGDPKFVLSHLCDGEGATTTTTSTTSTTTTTSTTSTTTSTSTSTTSTTTSTTTTLPCEWDPQLPPDHPECVEPTTTTASTTTTSTTSTTTTTTTLPCEWNPQLPPGSDDCVPALEVSALCFDLDNDGEIERYWHRLINTEDVDIDVTWADGAATIAANGSILVSSANATITLSVDGKAAATTPAPSDEFCQNSVEVEKIVEGPGELGRQYTIQISRLVDGEYIQEGDTFQLTAGEKITIPLPSTFNPEGVNYRIEEIDNGGANNTSVTPDSFNMNGHKGETISVVVQNDFAAISLEKTVDVTTISPGQELRYTLVAENTGALDLNPVVIYDRLPAEVIYVSYDIVGDAGSCALEQATRPQLVRCDLTGTFAPGAFTPAIELLVQVDPNLATTNPILNQAQSIGSYDGEPIDPLTLSFNGAVGEGRSFLQSESGDLSCEPTEGQVCDLSAKIGVGVTVEETTTTVVEQQPPTTVDTGSESPTTPAPELPKTGSDSTQMMVVLGALMVLLGGIMMLGTRRTDVVV